MKTFEHWQIAYRQSGQAKFQLVPNPTWAWAADPFLVDYRGKKMLFAELFLYKSERNGVIGYCEFDGNKFSEWTVSMDKHWHLSYPNIWEDNGKLYMCPESYQAEEIAIYELIELPNKWKKVKILMQNEKCVDSTFFRYAGEEYLFTYRLTNSGIIGELILYKVGKDGKLIEGKIVSDNIENARPGGKVIENDGKIIRVSQDSGNGYGSGLVFSVIENLYPVYRETEIKRIKPKDISIDNSSKYQGIHTYNKLGELEVIDLKYNVFSIREFLAQKRVRKVFLNKYC
ncbi:MAG: hypothetical protein IJN64_15630 [Lachnospiraceae bacterium]|nr:hypothetical protein [Lachnospiraceae bacterium]